MGAQIPSSYLFGLTALCLTAEERKQTLFDGVEFFSSVNHPYPHNANLITYENLGAFRLGPMVKIGCIDVIREQWEIKSFPTLCIKIGELMLSRSLGTRVGNYSASMLDIFLTQHGKMPAQFGKISCQSDTSSLNYITKEIFSIFQKMDSGKFAEIDMEKFGDQMSLLKKSDRLSWDKLHNLQKALNR